MITKLLLVKKQKAKEKTEIEYQLKNLVFPLDRALCHAEGIPPAIIQRALEHRARTLQMGLFLLPIGCNTTDETLAEIQEALMTTLLIKRQPLQYVRLQQRSGLHRLHDTEKQSFLGLRETHQACSEARLSAGVLEDPCQYL